MNDLNFHHISLVRKGRFAKLYIDAEPAFEYMLINDIPIVFDKHNVVLGQDQDCFGGCFETNQGFDGIIDDFRIYKRALTKPEIEQIYQLLNSN